LILRDKYVNKIFLVENISKYKGILERLKIYGRYCGVKLGSEPIHVTNPLGICCKTLGM